MTLQAKVAKFFRESLNDWKLTFEGKDRFKNTNILVKFLFRVLVLLVLFGWYVVLFGLTIGLLVTADWAVSSLGYSTYLTEIPIMVLVVVVVLVTFLMIPRFDHWVRKAFQPHS